MVAADDAVKGLLVIAAFVRVAAIVAVLAVFETHASLRGDELAKPAATEAKSPARRNPWMTSKVIGTPEPPLPYEVERVYKQLEFKQPVDISSAPGSERLFVVEQDGKVF